jgi:acetyltransferase-like isoleucine patch superfamily enzyme
VGNDVWIASNVTILKGVHIADGAVIAANSVVNCNVGPYEIWGGSPARKIGERQ